MANPTFNRFHPIRGIHQYIVTKYYVMCFEKLFVSVNSNILWYIYLISTFYKT